MPLLDLFWTMCMFFLFFAWLWVLFSIFADIFRSGDLSGWAKALWSLFVVIVPWLGALIYLIARGSSMQDRALAAATQREQATRQYIQQAAAGNGHSSADELATLARLRDAGDITVVEYETQKAKILN